MNKRILDSGSMPSLHPINQEARRNDLNYITIWPLPSCVHKDILLNRNLIDNSLVHGLLLRNCLSGNFDAFTNDASGKLLVEDLPHWKTPAELVILIIMPMAFYLPLDIFTSHIDMAETQWISHSPCHKAYGPWIFPCSRFPATLCKPYSKFPFRPLQKESQNPQHQKSQSTCSTLGWQPYGCTDRHFIARSFNEQLKTVALFLGWFIDCVSITLCSGTTYKDRFEPHRVFARFAGAS